MAYTRVTKKGESIALIDKKAGNINNLAKTENNDINSKKVGSQCLKLKMICVRR